MYSTSSCFRDTKSSSLDTLVLKLPSQEKWNHFGIIILSLPNYLLWNVLILATVVLNYILVTLDLTFPQENYEHFLYFYLIFDIFYLFNLFILVLHKTFDRTILPLFPKVDSSLVTIIIDFLSIVPQLLLLLILVDHSFSFFIPLLRIPSILRLWHLNLFKKVLGKLPENRWKWFVAQYGIIFCLSVHTANCVWFLICGADCQNKLYDPVPKTHRNPTDWYLFHIYYSIQILLNIGYGDTFPKNFNEIYLFSSLLLIGQALVVWLVCYVTWLLIYFNYHKICIAHKIKDAIKYVDDTDVSTKSKISNYYSMKEHNNFKDNSLLEKLPFSLKQDIFYDLNCGLLHRSMVLKELPDVMLKRISLAMKSVTLSAGENIYFQYVVKTCMVCIEDGILEVLNDEDQESPVILFKSGTILGEVALFFNIPSKASVRAKTNVDLRILEKRDFLEIIYRFPEHLKSLQTILSKRLLSANKTPNTIQKFCLPSLRRLKVKLSNIIVKNDIDMDSEEEYYDLYRLYGDKNKEANVADSRSVLFKTWRIISDIGQIVFCVIYPYYAVFEKDVPESLNYFGICTDISYLFDIIFQSTTPIKIEGRMVTSVSEILDQRLNQWKFNLDVFSLFPIEVWSALFENTTLENRFFDLLKLNRLLRLHRLIGVLKLLNEDINISIAMKILNVLICCTLCSYYSACILYLNACFVIICNDSSWYYLIPRKINEDANDSNSAIVDSLYFTVTSSFHTGIGDILPKSRSDYWIITILVVSFMILKSYWVGKITSFMFLNTLCNGFLETTYYFNYLTEVYRIPSNLKNKLYNFFKIDQHFFIENSKKLIHETVPNSLETQIQLSRTKDIWRKVRFLKKVDTYFLALVENHVNFWTIPNNEFVYLYGDPTRKMFVIRRGFCDLYNSENSLEKTVGPGSQLGLLEMIYCLPKKYTVVTKTDCILFYLDYFTFDHILKLFPKEYETLETVTFQKHLLESVAKLEIIEDTYENNEFKGLIEKEENHFINMTNKWPNYCEIYREKLGIFWGLSFILIPVTIYPESFCLKVWCIIRVCFIVIEAIIYGIIIVMAPYVNDVRWISWVCQGTLYLDMYLSLHIGYYDGYGKLKVHPLNTSWYYLTHGFLLDTIAAIPWQYLMTHSERTQFNDTDIDRVASHFSNCFWNLLKLIQFYKVFKCINYFEESYFQITKILKIFKLLSFIVLIAHILNSVNLGYICKYDFGVTKDLEFENQDATNKWGKIKCENEFLTEAWLHNGTTGTIKIYIAGLFTIVDWLTNTGIGYFKPSTMFSKIVAIFTTLFGFLIFSIMTSTICSIMLADAEETVNFRNNISKLFKFLDKNKVNSNLKQKILGHFKLIWDRTKGFDIESKTYTDNYFRDKILLNYHEEIFYRVPLLYHFDMSYMKLILCDVRIQHFQKGAVIVNYKDVLSDIYIVTSGQVEIFSKTEDPLCLLGSGAVFGNIRKNVHGLSKVRVTARRNIELWVVTTQSFFNTVKYYPLVVQELENMLIRKPAYLLPVDTSNFFVFSGSKGLIDELESDEEEVVNKTSNMTCKDSKTIYRRKWTKFHLKPNHAVFKILDFLTFATSLLNIFIIPYIFVTQETHYFGYLYLCLEPIFLIRIFFKLHQSYINMYGNVITSNKKLCKRYLNTPRQFFWDIVPNLPVTFIFYSFGSEERFFFYTCVRLFHLLRFYYITEYFQMHTAKLFRKNWWYFVRLVVYYSILVHVLACTWFMIACPFNQCIHDTWITQFSENVSEKPAVYKIILSYYYILTLVTTTGFGDISPKSCMEVVFTLMTILIGKIFISVIIGSVLKAIYISEKQHLKFDMQAKLLKSYLKDKNISDFLMDKISIYLENLWIHEEGIMDLNIIKSLSYPLQQDLMLALYGNQIGETFVFKGIDQSLLLQICTKLKRSVYFKDDYIAKTGDVSSTMYFINSGNVVVLTKHLQLIETKHVILQPLDLFGVCQGLCLEECHNYCYRAATYVVEILSLKYEDWSYLLDFFPRDKQQIFVKVHKEYKKMTE